MVEAGRAGIAHLGEVVGDDAFRVVAFPMESTVGGGQQPRRILRQHLEEPKQHLLPLELRCLHIGTADDVLEHEVFEEVKLLESRAPDDGVIPEQGGLETGFGIHLDIGNEVMNHAAHRVFTFPIVFGKELSIIEVDVVVQFPLTEI